MGEAGLRRILAVAVITGLAWLAGCAPAPKTAMGVTLATALGRHAPASAPPEANVILVQEALSDPAPAAPSQKLLCDAPSLSYLVGHKRTDIPVAADLTKRRVACTTCPGSEDRRPERTDILFDARTGLVTAVTCG